MTNSCNQFYNFRIICMEEVMLLVRHLFGTCPLLILHLSCALLNYGSRPFAVAQTGGLFPFFRLIHQQVPILQFVGFSHQQVAEEELKIMTILANAFCNILVVGPDQGVTEKPRMFLKLPVVRLETD